MTIEPGSIVRAEGREWADSDPEGCVSRRLIVWQAFGYHLDFQVHQAAGYDEDGVTPLFGTFNDGKFPGPEPCEDSKILDGSVKWDGCTQWSPADHCHYDDCESVPDLRAIIGQCWRLAAEHVSHWSEDVAGAPPPKHADAVAALIRIRQLIEIDVESEGATGRDVEALDLIRAALAKVRP